MLTVRCTQRTVRVDVPLLRRQLKRAVAAVRDAQSAPVHVPPARDVDVGVWFAGDATVRALNARYRSVRRVTDTLAFASRSAAPRWPPASGADAPSRAGSEAVSAAASSGDGDARALGGHGTWRDADDEKPSNGVEVAESEPLDLGTVVVAPAFVRRRLAQQRARARAHGTASAVALPCEPPSLAALGDVPARQTLDAHLAAIAVHGVCHLFGYLHETDAQYATMLAAERRAVLALAPLLQPGAHGST